MAFYHVELGYRTKRGGSACGITVQAFGPDEAEEFARAKFLKGHPARQWAFTKIREADAEEAKTAFKA